MYKRLRSILCTLLAVILLAGTLPMTAAAASTPFADVADTDWFANSVLWAVEQGITSGISPTEFGPNNPCTRAQVVTFLWAANGKPEPNTTINPFTDVPNNAWYLKPVLWAVERGITGGTSNTTFSPDNECTRAQIVTFLYAAAGKPTVNATTSGFIDVLSTDWFVKPVLWAKENDITGGTGPNTFGPLNVCTRGQVVTFLYKAYGTPTQPTPTIKPTNQPVVTSAPTPVPTPEPTPAPTPVPDTKLNAEEIYAKCASAVFYIEIYNRAGQAISSGSGVFLNSNGLAITNHHVVEDAYSAKIMTNNGSVFNVKGYYDAKEAIDMALIQIDGSGFNYLPVGDYQSIAGGQNIFAIGSPKGLDNSISTGIISNPKRLLNGIDFIQMTAPISPGSSGGALINDKGQLIGINTAYYEGGQNLNLAVPIYHKDELSTDSLKSFPLGSSGPALTGASISVNNSVAIKKGSTETIEITCNRGNYPGNLTISYEIAQTMLCAATWNAWNGDSTSLNITGNAVGTTTITFTLYTEDDELLASETITVTVTEPIADYGASINFVSNLSVNNGGSNTLRVTCDPGSYPYPDDVSVYFLPANESIATAEWGEWDGWDIDLYVSGKSTGTTTIDVLLLDKDDGVLASKTVTVTVTTANRGQAAFVAMRDWILANHNDMLGDSYVYSELYEEDAEGKMECAVLYTPGDDYIEIAIWSDIYEGGTIGYVDAFIDLDSNYTDAYGSVYVYFNGYEDSDMVFKGFAEIDKKSFCSSSNIAFYETYGEKAISADCANILKYSALGGLDFANYLFKNYIPGGYSILDFGYGDIYR